MSIIPAHDDTHCGLSDVYIVPAAKLPPFLQISATSPSVHAPLYKFPAIISMPESLQIAGNCTKVLTPNDEPMLKTFRLCSYLSFAGCKSSIIEQDANKTSKEKNKDQIKANLTSFKTTITISRQQYFCQVYTSHQK